MVYIAEAHAEDEWPISSARHNGGRGVVSVMQTRTLAQRRAAAETLVADFAVPTCVRPGGDGVRVFVDDPERGEPFEQTFAPWPLRFWVVGAGGRITFIAEPTGCSFDLSLLRDHLLQGSADSAGARS